MQRILKSFLFFLLACLLVSGSSAQENNTQDVMASQVSIVGQPLFNPQTGLVQVDVMVRDAQGFAVADLSPHNFDLGPAAAEVQLIPHTDSPLTLAIIVDTSAGSSITLIKDTLLAYFEHYHQPQDDVTFYVVNYDAEALRRFSESVVVDRAEAVATINGLRGGEAYYLVQPALEAALNDLVAATADPLLPRQALFMGSFLNSPRETALATAFPAAGIPLHVVQVHHNRDQVTGVYRELADYGDGLFANNRNGVLVLGETHEPINALKVLYDTIANSRLVYTLTFQPDNVRANHTQPLTISVTLPDGSQAETAGQYTLALEPPAVTFASAEPFDITLEPAVGADGALLFDNSYQPVTLLVSYPDNVRRSLRVATVTITDEDSGRTVQVLQVINPQPDEDGAILLDWALTPLLELEDMNLHLSAVVTDQTGLTGTANQTGQLTIAGVEQLVAAIAGGVVRPADTGPTTWWSVIPFATEPVLWGANVALALAVLVLLGFVFLRRRRPVPVPSARDDLVLPQQPREEFPADVPGSAAAPVEAVEAKEAGALECYGQLLVREGADDISVQHAVIAHDRFLIGRGTDCDLIMDQPYVSPEHCLITFRGNRFFVRDLGSKNGTYVNGERIRQDHAEVDVPLGSEIAITRNIVLEIRGADYEFVLAGTDVSHGTTHYSTVVRDEVEFKRLPGLRYAPDQGPDVDDEYSPF